MCCILRRFGAVPSYLSSPLRAPLHLLLLILLLHLLHAVDLLLLNSIIIASFVLSEGVFLGLISRWQQGDALCQHQPKGKGRWELVKGRDATEQSDFWKNGKEGCRTYVTDTGRIRKKRGRRAKRRTKRNMNRRSGVMPQKCP